MNSIFRRVSVRRFLDRPVEDEKITLLLKAAMASPSTANQQPWEFVVVKDREMIQKLSECSPFAKFAKNAPLIIVPCARCAEEVKLPEWREIDLSIASENILLEAVELGLGATWCGIAPLQERVQLVSETLGLPARLSAFALIPVGYPAEERPQEDRFDETRIHII